MAISFTCPSCESGLKLRDDLAGRKVKCPRCKDVIVVPGAEDESEEEERERPRKKKRKRKKKSNLLVGLLAGVLLLLVGGTVAIVFALSGGKKEEPRVSAPPKKDAGPPAAAKPEPKPRKGKDLINAVARRIENSEVLNWFRQLGLSYQTVETTNGKGPASFAELTELARSPLKEWLDKEWIEVVWGARLSNLPAGRSGTALAWETAPDQFNQRVVLLCDGTVREIDEATFKTMPKAGR